jgi:hypothetical protein
LPLLTMSVLSLALFPFLSQRRRNYLLIVVAMILPPTLFYLFCVLFKINHFVSSRYFINLLPLFLIALFLSADGIACRLKKWAPSSYLRFFFTLFFVVSNIYFLPRYYSSEKQDFRSLTRYLESRLRNSDTVFVGSLAYVPGILHYFGVFPESRNYSVPISEASLAGREFRISLTSRQRAFSIVYSNSCCGQYTGEGKRLWIVVGKPTYQRIRNIFPCILMGVFDGSVSNFRRFPSDASMYLLLWDPEIKGGLSQGPPNSSTEHTR